MSAQVLEYLNTQGVRLREEDQRAYVYTWFVSRQADGGAAPTGACNARGARQFWRVRSPLPVGSVNIPVRIRPGPISRHVEGLYAKIGGVSASKPRQDTQMFRKRPTFFAGLESALLAALESQLLSSEVQHRA